MGKADYKKLIKIIQEVEKVEVDIENMVFISGAPNDEKAKRFRDFYQDFIRETLHTKNALRPRNLFEFLQLLKAPIGDWGYFNIKNLKERKINTELKILNNYTGISSEARTLLNEYESYEELTTGPIVDIMIHCQQKVELGKKQYQEIYADIRTFLITNPLTTLKKVKEKSLMNWNRDRMLLELIEGCYEEFDSSKYRYGCPYCGWTVEEQPGGYILLSKDCYDHFDINKMYETSTEEYTLRLSKTIQRTTVIPGLKELELKKMLENKGLKVELYPRVEMDGDLKVINPLEEECIVLNIDVKDYVYPISLAEKILQDISEGRQKTAIISVPNSKANKTYLKAANQFLLKHGIDHVKVYSFKETVKMAQGK
ncbi:hypothetical protein ACN1JM_000719 [Bacillus pacificus]